MGFCGELRLKTPMGSLWRGEHQEREVVRKQMPCAYYQAYTYGMLKEFFRQMCQGKKGGGTTPFFGMATYFLIGMVCQVGIKGNVSFK